MANRKLVVEIIGDSRSLNRNLGAAQRSLLSFSGRMSRDFRGLAASMGVLSGAGGIAGVALAARSATKAAADFEVTMQKVVGLSGVAQGKISGLSDAILKLAPSVGKGPQELAEALQFITSSGIDADHAMAVLEVSAKAAAAGLGETKSVADAVTSVMNAYGASVVSAKSATDTLVATVREGKGEADEFAGVIGNVVAIASQLDVSFNDVGAALAAMTRLGTDAATSATQLQQVFSNLVKVSPQQAKAFEAVGLSAAGLRKELRDRGLLATLRTIKTAFAGDLPGLSKAFGDIRALRGVLALVGSQADETAGIFERMSGSAGSLGDAFKAVANTSAQQFARFNAAIDATRITIGAALAPAAEKAARAIADWLSESKNQERVQRDVRKAVRTVTDAVHDAVGAFQDMRESLGPVVERMGGLAGVAKLFVAALVASKVAAFVLPVEALGRSAAASAGEVSLLRGALLRLGAIGVITLGIEVALNKDTIQTKVNQFLRQHGLGFATSKPIKLPVDIDETKLDKARRKLKEMGDSGSVLAEALQKAAEKMRALGTAASEGLNAASKIEAARGADTVSRKGAGISGAVKGAVDFFQKALDQATEAGQTAATNAARAAAKQAATARRSAAAAKKAADAQREAFDGLIASLGLQVDKAAASKGFADDLKANADLQSALKRQIAVEGRTTELASQLFQAQQARADTLVQQAQAAADARAKAAAKIQASQFKALGLTGEGDARTPGVPNLKKQLEQLTARLGPEVSPKIESQLKAVGRVLSGALGKVTLETRRKILELFQAIRSTFDQQAKGPLTKTTSLSASKLFKGLTLPPDLARELRSRVSGFNSAGVGLAPQPAGAVGAFGMLVPQVDTQVDVRIDGRQVEPMITKRQKIRSRRNPPQKRGPHGI